MNVVVSTSVVRRFVGGHLGHIAISLRCTAERTLSAGLFHVLLGSFCFHRFVSEWHCHSSNSLLLLQGGTFLCRSERCLSYLGKALFATLDCISFSAILSLTCKRFFDRQCFELDRLQRKKKPMFTTWLSCRKRSCALTFLSSNRTLISCLGMLETNPVESW